MAPSFGFMISDLFFIRLFFSISALAFAAMSVFLMILNLQSFSGLSRQGAGVR